MNLKTIIICGALLTSLYNTGFAAPAAPKSKPVVKTNTQTSAWPSQDPAVRTSMYVRLLNMTPDQVKKLSSLTTKHNAQYAKIGQSKSDITVRLKMARELRKNYQKSIMALLSPAQKDRFSKITASEVRVEMLRQQLNLTQEQSVGMAKLMKEAGDTIKRLQEAESKKEITADQRAKGFAEARKKLDDGVKSLLTPQQIQKMNQGFSKR